MRTAHRLSRRAAALQPDAHDPGLVESHAEEAVDSPSQPHIPVEGAQGLSQHERPTGVHEGLLLRKRAPLGGGIGRTPDERRLGQEHRGRQTPPAAHSVRDTLHGDDCPSPADVDVWPGPWAGPHLPDGTI